MLLIGKRFVYVTVALVVQSAATTAVAGQRDMREFLGLGPPPDAAAAKAGEPLFQANCAACHGQNARGGEGPNLVRSAVVLHDTKGDEIGAVVKNGRPQAGMPAFPGLTPTQVYDIAEYLHQQVDNAANRGLYGKEYAGKRSQTSGDAKQGEEFFAKNCSGCHSASGDLAHIGTKYPQAVAMQSRFAWPTPKGPGEITVTTPSGEKISGTLDRLDDFDVALRDSNGVYHHWARDKVSVKTDEDLDGHRSLLPKYTDADLHNLTAYLLTLK